MPFLIIVRVGFGLTHTLKVKKITATSSGSRTGPQSINIMRTQETDSFGTTTRNADGSYKDNTEYPMEYIQFSDKQMPTNKHIP